VWNQEEVKAGETGYYILQDLPSGQLDERVQQDSFVMLELRSFTSSIAHLSLALTRSLRDTEGGSLVAIGPIAADLTLRLGTMQRNGVAGMQCMH
jgi:hypothetical protein